METAVNITDVCCTKFDADAWEDKVFVWHGKNFIREQVYTFLYMPLNFGSVMRKLDKIVHSAGVDVKDMLCLSDHRSPWKMDVLLAVDRPVKEADNVKLSGEFFSKVYEGAYSNTGKWSKDFQTEVENRGMHIDKLYIWYTTCPKCAKKYGKNYVTVIGQIS